MSRHRRLLDRPRRWRPPSRAREISARELLDLHLARIAERNPELNAIVSASTRSAPGRGAAEADERLARGERARPAARAAVRVQGHPRGRRLAYDVRLAAVRRPRPQARRPGRRADPGGRRGPDRQDQRAGVRGRLAHLQPGLRHHPQPGRPDPVGRRLERGSGVRAGERGWCRSPTAPTWAARCATPRRSAASSGCGPASGRVPAWPTDQPLGDHLGQRPDGPQRRGPRPAAVGDRRAATRGCRLSLETPGVDLRAAARTATCAGLRVALVGRPRRRASRSTTRSRTWSREPGRGVRGGRRPRRGRAPGPAQRRRGLPDAARLAVPGAGSGALLAEHPDGVQAVAGATTSGPARTSPAPTSPAAYQQLTSIPDRMRAFFETYDVLVLPVSQVPPFRADQEYPADDQRPSRRRRTWTGCARRT